MAACLRNILIFIFGINFLSTATATTTTTTATIIAHTIPVICKNENGSNSVFNDRFIDFMQKWQLPGAAVAIMQNNKMQLSCGYGWANVEHRQPVQPDSIFRIGSVSKTITAIAILRLIQDHKLKLDDKVFAILSDLKPLGKHNPHVANISIRNLLQMSSGWYSDRPQDYDPLFGPWSVTMLKQFNYQIPPDCRTATRFMMSVPLQFKPGSEFSYSNLNYCVLGLVINKLSQQEGADGYEAYIKQSMLEPLNIKSMQLGSTRIENKMPQEVNYYYDGTNKTTAEDVDRILDGLPYSQTELLKKNYADGGWIASAPDLAKLMQALSSNQILHAEIFNLMKQKPAYSKVDSGYPAMGWDEVSKINGHTYWSKTGRFTGTHAFIMQGDNGVSYAVLFNTKPGNWMQFTKELQQLLLA